jgi:hypothetical protein
VHASTGAIERLKQIEFKKPPSYFIAQGLSMYLSAENDIKRKTQSKQQIGVIKINDSCSNNLTP